MKRPKSVGEAWRIIILQEGKIEELRANIENLRNTITSTHLSLKERDAENERLQVVISAGIGEVQKVCDNRQHWHHGPVEGLEDWAVHAADYLPEED